MEATKNKGADYHYYNVRYEAILKDFWTEVDCKFVDSFAKRLSNMEAYAREKMNLGYAEFLEFIEFIVRHSRSPEGLTSQINAVLEETGCAYRIVDRTITPVSSQEVADAITSAYDHLSGFENGRSHLRKSAELLTANDYAGSIRESVHAVEAVARRLAPSAQTLGPALSAIEKTHELHPALKKGFAALYGFTSDEQGIRHALIDKDTAKVSEQEAIYMLGSCSTFASYLASFARPQLKPDRT